ncbi:[FeFe] hydrogenase H-cluster radical SAM maturase HydE [Clostridium luticellarii]|jgi:biotin synthase|uniref:Biotin synthase n=1 Tax=Clostridium luticellarii TaxID=1691940 RepID=A0A2T0BNB3_9CLOT|nr:[FeFe] hydrogenase H-cluster radical SAM maturase HydE [Clostridium luticellarii]MCI1945454.1 [FeFe] hydrogenase H-cluster radical SAM maturase HydE [Clostridium luticellarii]MCI1968787.1 [FeFe] hydrogenase H-cluster radical SAM maturase HydE [Clostridium luticellarii]MCI1994939.1 [FeFe] hydrogenase H-cluster radical SAM maturase HydE [Clostridium luticellarii]MCI2040214.1 [FeFe] hydrogenase H-cluster radical SAM maturase HydE [Clostridium luticellarii]PRR85378.1 Biotin synthase [Clostridiu
MNKLISLIQRAEYSHSLSKSEIVSLFKDNDCTEELFKAADRVRKKYVGDDVHLRGLIEFSNICKRNCMYCGLRRDNKNIKRYRIQPDEIIRLAEKAVGYGYKTIVMQSGEDDYYTVDKLRYIISNIKKMDVALTLSIGEKTFEEYKAYKEAGADRYLIRIETTDPVLYKKMDPGMSHENRKRCLRDLKTLGYEVGTGCLIGLPEQSFESLADDILFFKDIDADMIGVGPFIPNEDTPLKDETGGDFLTSLKVVAVTRLLMPNINIPATTAMETLNPRGRTITLQSGANVVMPNVTEGVYRKLYALYPGKICTGDTPANCKNCITGKIVTIGRAVSASKGFRVKA